MKGKIWPIKSEIKSKRIKWTKEPTFINWAYNKELRENNKTKKIYDINPYVEVYQFRDNLYGFYAENADGMSDVWMFLIIGPEKAFLIDTGFGIGDLKGLVDEITGGMPLIVANTHGSFDHAYGDCLFEKVYCHKYEVPRIKAQDAHIWDYLFDKDGNCIWMEFDKNDLPEWKEFEIIPCENNHIFNLGEDYEIEMIWLPGHSPGHTGFIDKKNRILFPGDAMSSGCSGLGTVNTTNQRQIKYYGEYAKYGNIASYRKELEKLVERMDEFDYVFPMHNIVNLEKGIVPCILRALEEVLADPEKADDIEVFINKDGKRQESLVKHIKGYSALSYRL
jgi:glyoxylase-like metal-dependent hydrolase (beta-lactamase superfamily II)